MKKVEISVKKLNLLKSQVKKYNELRESIEKEQGQWDEENDVFIENKSADLCTIGEIVLNHFDLWL